MDTWIDGMGWDRMGWDGMGWERTGCDRMGYGRMKSDRSKQNKTKNIMRLTYTGLDRKNPIVLHCFPLHDMTLLHHIALKCIALQHPQPDYTTLHTLRTYATITFTITITFDYNHVSFTCTFRVTLTLTWTFIYSIWKPQRFRKCSLVKTRQTKLSLKFAVIKLCKSNCK